MLSIEHVKHSYWEWFESEQYFKSRMKDIFFIGFQENLTDNFECLKRKLRLPEYVKLPIDNVQAHRNPEHLDRTLEERALNNLKDWYKEDYKLIDLCRDVQNNNL